MPKRSIFVIILLASHFFTPFLFAEEVPQAFTSEELIEWEYQSLALLRERVEDYQRDCGFHEEEECQIPAYRLNGITGIVPVVDTLDQIYYLVEHLALGAILNSSQNTKHSSKRRQKSSVLKASLSFLKRSAVPAAIGGGSMAASRYSHSDASYVVHREAMEAVVASVDRRMEELESQMYDLKFIETLDFYDLQL